MTTKHRLEELSLQLELVGTAPSLSYGSMSVFLDGLCRTREYQKKAVHLGLNFLYGGKYAKTADLMRTNWETRTVLQGVFEGSFETYLASALFPERIAATLDIATATGKSYVMFGIARLALAFGLADRVLVLCPTTTIEQGLRDKFSNLLAKPTLLDALPQAGTRLPRLIDGQTTFQAGDICIENAHQVYEGRSSALRALSPQDAQRTLVLNDEVHHVYSGIEEATKAWKKYLNDFGFPRILGFTGTAYLKNDYFVDVIFRYSLKNATDARIVKLVDYVNKDESRSEHEKFQKIVAVHKRNKANYSEVKPLTLFVTDTIATAERLAERFVAHLIAEGDPAAASRVLLVTSKHPQNVARLSTVDSRSSPVEWLLSVSMLSEGWDVKNVFQIVPHDERAFNSKLLIAQVLGRGLRIPEEYASEQPMVSVFNHASWSSRIRELVDEVIDIEPRITSRSISNEESPLYSHHFELHRLETGAELEEQAKPQLASSFDYSRKRIRLITQVKTEDSVTTYHLSNEVTTTINNVTHSVDSVAEEVLRILQSIEWERDNKRLILASGSYGVERLPSLDEIKQYISESLELAGCAGHDWLSDENKRMVLTSFQTLLRRTNSTAIYKSVAGSIEAVFTKDLGPQSVSVSRCRGSPPVSLMFSEDSVKEMSSFELDLLGRVEADEMLVRRAIKRVGPTSAAVELYKSPVTLTVAESSNEYEFVKKLLAKPSADRLKGWVKSRDRGFYEIEYSVHSRNRNEKRSKVFNPDYLLALNAMDEVEHIAVVELKDDNDPDPLNPYKLAGAREYFALLNDELDRLRVKQKYHFFMLGPSDFGTFFARLTAGELCTTGFVSRLEHFLEANTDT